MRRRSDLFRIILTAVGLIAALMVIVWAMAAVDAVIT